ncbi:hypothetical protein GGP50_003377 [Salinibacter ruber]|nr:hypothetical protein [Salinibacter ruber]
MAVMSHTHSGVHRSQNHPTHDANPSGDDLARASIIVTGLGAFFASIAGMVATNSSTALVAAGLGCVVGVLISYYLRE